VEEVDTWNFSLWPHVSVANNMLIKQLRIAEKGGNQSIQWLNLKLRLGMLLPESENSFVRNV
jgi:hypothetical protein